MKKKLIAVVISTLLAGGVGTTALYNYNKNNTPVEISQVSGEEIASQDEAQAEPIENTEVQEKINENSKPASSVKSDTQTVKQQNAAVKQQTQVNNNSTVSSGTSDEAFLAQVEQLIYTKVNEQRAANGVSQLSYNTTMQKYARIKSQDMGDKNYFDHKDLNGNLITVKMKEDGVTYNAWGENIAYISGNSDAKSLADQFMTNWMNSEGHRANILSNNFSSIGIGVYKVGNKVYATQEFYA